MSQMNGIEATRAIHQAFSRIRTISVSMFDEPEQAQAMYAAGALQYFKQNRS